MPRICRLSPIFFALSLAAMLPACTPETPSSPAVVAASETRINQAALDEFANTLGVEWRMLANEQGGACDAKESEGACFSVQISLTPAEGFPAEGWTIYLHTFAPVQSADHPGFEIQHLNGELHALRPTKAFKGWQKDQTEKLTLRIGFWSVSAFDALPNWYVTGEGLAPRVLDATRPAIDAESGLELLPFVAGYEAPAVAQRNADDKTLFEDAAALYAENEQRAAPALAAEALALQVLPQPTQIRAGKGQLSLENGLKVTASDFDAADTSAAFERLAALGVAQSEAGVPVSLKKSAKSGAVGSYQLSVRADGVRIEAPTATGAFYALQTLAGLYELGSKAVPVVEVQDAPRYPWRGLHFDVARNFHSKDTVLKLLDQLAAYKMNRLHFHLADDEGWRIEIPGLEELTSYASKRCHSEGERDCLQPSIGSGPDADVRVNGYYSRADYAEILKAARARHIEVIPSFDMPGHARAAVRAMRIRHDRLLAAGQKAEAEQYLLDDAEDATRYLSIQFYKDNTLNVCLPSSYAFFDKVISELKAAHAEAGVPLAHFHIGADETPGAWLESPVCKAWLAQNEDGVRDPKLLGPHFIEKVAGILERHGIQTAGWSDGLEHARAEKMPKRVAANAWSSLFWDGHKNGHRLANRGWDVVISSPDVTYFDFPNDAHPLERGLYWGSRHTDTRKVFEFMPDNLPANALRWLDREGKPYVADDTPQKNADGSVAHAPLKAGQRFHGLQAQLWGEVARQDYLPEYQLFPRLMALAERAWKVADWEIPYDAKGAKYAYGPAPKQAELDADWRRFAATLGQKELPKLDKAGVRYRIPMAGAVLRDGQIWVNAEFPGLRAEVRFDGDAWQPWTGPIPVGSAKSISVRLRSADGQRAGRAWILGNPVSSTP